MRTYIGTEKHIFDIEPYLQDNPQVFKKFVDSGLYLSGGGYSVGGSYAAKYTELAFRRTGKGHETEVIDGLVTGRYGSGHIYWYDVNADNILPSYLSLPAKAVKSEGGVITWDRFASAVLVDVPDNTFDLPFVGATITMPPHGKKKAFSFIVPDHYDLAVSIKGDSSDVKFVLDWGGETDLEVCGLDSLWDSVIRNPGERLATLTTIGYGDMTLYSLMIMPVRQGMPIDGVESRYPRFVVGKGQSGCTLIDDTVTNRIYAIDTSWEVQPTRLALLETEWFDQ
ncbi:MAG: hypothetical protein FWD45_04265 [Coriobacteriia bacterium]|nr:hypothetical protein [Coriobacteriia bacterium]